MTSLHRLAQLRHLPAITLTVVVLGLIGVFSGDRTMLDTMTLIAIFALMALAVGMCFGQAGIMTLGQAAFAAIGAYTTAILTTRFELPIVIGAIAAILLPAAIAYPFARLTVRLSHLALALATLFLGEIVVVLLAEGGTFTGGHLGLGGIPSLTDDPVVFTLIAWAFVVLGVVLYSNLIASAAGRALNTLRSDRLRSEADGDRGPHRLAMLFALAAGMCGAAGMLYAHYLTYLAPESLSPVVSISLLLMVIVGGARFVLGPVVGATVLTLLSDHLPDEIEGLLYGATLIVVLLLAPKGLLGALHGLRLRLAPRRERGGTATDTELEKVSVS